MKKSKLILTLEVFDRKTLNKIDKFIQSPYYNRDKALVTLYQLISSVVLKKKKMPSKEQIWQSIRPDLDFNDLRFRKYNSDLLGLIEQFLIVEEMAAQKGQQQIFLLKAIAKRGLKVLQNSAIASAESIAARKDNLDTNNLNYNYQLQKEKYNLLYRYDRKMTSNIQDILSNFDQYFLAERYKLATDQISRSKFINVNLEDPFGESVFSTVNDGQIALHEIGKVYQAVYQSQKNKTIDSYFHLRKIINDLELPLSPLEAGSIYASQINFCIRQINSGDSKFLNELFILYKELIDKNLIISNDRIAPNTYSNITVTALRVQQYVWAEDFILNYAQYLPVKNRDNLPKYEMALLYFYKKEFEKVIEVLRDFEFEDQFDALQAKALQIYTYYELREFEVLDSLLRSLKTYITRHKEIDPNRGKNYKNLIKVITQMMSIIPGDQKRITKLKETMANMKGIAANQEWLAEKIAELER